MKCLGICSEYKVKTLRPKGNGRYETGQKRCSFCDIFIEWDGDRCPCCNCFLRKKPRNYKARDKIVQNGNGKKIP